MDPRRAAARRRGSCRRACALEGAREYSVAPTYGASCEVRTCSRRHAVRAQMRGSNSATATSGSLEQSQAGESPFRPNPSAEGPCSAEFSVDRTLVGRRRSHGSTSVVKSLALTHRTHDPAPGAGLGEAMVHASHFFKCCINTTCAPQESHAMLHRGIGRRSRPTSWPAASLFSSLQGDNTAILTHISTWPS